MSDTLHLDDEILCAYLDGELTEVESQAAVEHQWSCAPCRRRAESLRGVATLLGSGLAGSGFAGSGFAGSGFAGSAPFSEVPAPEAGEMEMILAAAEVAPAPAGSPGPRWLRVGASVAAVVAAAGLALAALGYHHPAPPRGATGLAVSLGTFSDASSLRATLAAEVASLAPGRSGQVLPCHEKAALSVGQPAASTAAFSAPLTYAGIPAEVFAYRTPIVSTPIVSTPIVWTPGAATAASGSSGTSVGGSTMGQVAVVVRDGDCTAVARLGW